MCFFLYTFGFKPIWLYSFCYSNCSRFGCWELFPLTSLSLWYARLLGCMVCPYLWSSCRLPSTPNPQDRSSPAIPPHLCHLPTGTPSTGIEAAVLPSSHELWNLRNSIHLLLFFSPMEKYGIFWSYLKSLLLISEKINVISLSVILKLLYTREIHVLASSCYLPGNRNGCRGKILKG